MTTATDTRPAGLTATVLGSRMGDHTARGISSTAQRLTIVGTVDRRTDLSNRKSQPLGRGSQVFEAREDCPAAVIVFRRMMGQPDAILAPAAWNDVTGEWELVNAWTMFGGNAAHLGDSRLCEVLRDHGIPSHVAVLIHDRIEG